MHEMPDALILCGGLGTRLRSVTGAAPKSLAEVAGRPFMELLLRQLYRHGFKCAILAVGYQAEAIRAHFGEKALGLRLAYSFESTPLGTGGALRNAADVVESDTVLVMNGDSYTEADLAAMLADFYRSNSDACLVLIPADGRNDSGSVCMDEAGKIVGFVEKAGAFRAPFVSAGIYLMRRKLLFDIPSGREVSLEKEIFPRWLRDIRQIRGFVFRGTCTDIGTPERLREAQEVLVNAEAQDATSLTERAE
jgi:NDP-sugar pyrophosphorylase family protein